MGQKFNLPYLSAGGRAGELNQIVGKTGGSGVLYDARHAMAGNILATEAGAGITAGTGTIYKSAVSHNGGIYHTQILLDLTGLHSEATDLDIIGVDASTAAAHLGQITAAVNGTIFAGQITCHELPAGGDPNIAFYSATEATGVEDSLISALTERVLLDPAGDWAAGTVHDMTGWPVANEYLYAVQGDATGTDADYTGGKFVWHVGLLILTICAGSLA